MISVKIQFTVIQDRNVPDRSAAFRTYQLPGHDIAVVLHATDQHFVSRVQVGTSPGRSDQVDPFRRAPYEYNLPFGSCMNIVA